VTVVVSDSSTLIALLDIGRFSLLFDLFETVVISREVYEEIRRKNPYREQIDPLLESHRLQIRTIEDEVMYTMLIKRLDPGESESIILARHLDVPLVIDEKKGRSIAKTLGIPVIGLVGILLKWVDRSVLTREEALSILEELERNNFRLSDALKRLLLDELQ